MKKFVYVWLRISCLCLLFESVKNVCCLFSPRTPRSFHISSTNNNERRMNSSNSGNNNNNNKCNKNNIVLYPLHRNKRAHKHIFRFLLTFKKKENSLIKTFYTWLSVCYSFKCMYTRKIYFNKLKMAFKCENYNKRIRYKMSV